MAYIPFPVSASTFSTTDEGWSGSSTSDLLAFTAIPAIIKYDMPGKAMVYTPPGVIPVNTKYYFQAPAGYLENKSAVYGGSLSFSLTLDGTAGTSKLIHNNYNLILDGGGLVIGYDMLQSKPDPSSSSQRYDLSVPIEAGKGWSKFTSPSTWTVASEAEIKTVLKDLKRVLILGNCANDLTATALKSVKLIPRELPDQPMPLEIHTINVSQGDSILVINRNLYALEEKIDKWIDSRPLPKPAKPASAADWLPFAMAKKIDIAETVRSAVLIDAGNKEFGINVINYMKAHGVEKGKFSVVITHYHDDHYDGFIYSINKKATLPSNPDVVFWSYPPGAIYDCGSDTKFDPLTYKSAIKSNIQRYRSNVHDLCTKLPASYKALEPDDAIDMGTPSEPMRLYCVAANGYIWTGLAAESKRPAKAKKEEQNSRSVALVLEYGDFRYYLAGDLGGAETKDNSQTTGEDYGTKQAVGSQGYWNIEIPLAEQLPNIYKKDAKRSNTVAGHICCIKSSHHGSQWHTNTKLLRIMQPCVCVFSSGLKKSFHKHPTQETLARVDYAATKDGATTKNAYSPEWPDRTSGAPVGITQVDNTFSGGLSYSYFITEMKKPVTTGKKSKQFKREYPNGKIVGSVIVRPYLTDILSIVNNPAKNTDIRIQIYASGETSDIYNPVKYADKLEVPEKKNAGYPATASYPVGPWIHICGKH